MNTFWILFGAGLFTFLACAGIATIIGANRTAKPSPFKGTLLDEENTGSIFDDEDEVPGLDGPQMYDRLEEKPKKPGPMPAPKKTTKKTRSKK